MVGNYVTDGGIVKALGGVSLSQIINAEPASAVTNCGNLIETYLGDPKKTFCVLSDISIRAGNSIARNNAGGWNVCKIEIAQGASRYAGKLVLIAQMDGQCPLPPAPQPEIACWAKCIRF